MFASQRQAPNTVTIHRCQQNSALHDDDKSAHKNTKEDFDMDQHCHNPKRKCGDTLYGDGMNDGRDINIGEGRSSEDIYFDEIRAVLDRRDILRKAEGQRDNNKVRKSNRIKSQYHNDDLTNQIIATKNAEIHRLAVKIDLLKCKLMKAHDNYRKQEKTFREGIIAFLHHASPATFEKSCNLLREIVMTAQNHGSLCDEGARSTHNSPIYLNKQDNSVTSSKHPPPKKIQQQRKSKYKRCSDLTPIGNLNMNGCAQSLPTQATKSYKTQESLMTHDNNFKDDDCLLRQRESTASKKKLSLKQGRKRRRTRYKEKMKTDETRLESKDFADVDTKSSAHVILSSASKAVSYNSRGNVNQSDSEENSSDYSNSQLSTILWENTKDKIEDESQTFDHFSNAARGGKSKSRKKDRHVRDKYMKCIDRSASSPRIECLSAVEQSQKETKYQSERIAKKSYTVKSVDDVKGIDDVTKENETRPYCEPSGHVLCEETQLPPAHAKKCSCSPKVTAQKTETARSPLYNNKLSPRSSRVKHFESSSENGSIDVLLNTIDCRECRKFFASMGLSYKETKIRIEEVSRHKCIHHSKNLERENTPPHFYEMDFPDTQQDSQQQHLVKPVSTPGRKGGDPTISRQWRKEIKKKFFEKYEGKNNCLSNDHCQIDVNRSQVEFTSQESNTGTVDSTASPTGWLGRSRRLKDDW